jgi:ribose transport system substrate-binding protein
MPPKNKATLAFLLFVLFCGLSCDSSRPPAKPGKQSAPPNANAGDTGGSVRRLIILTNGEDPFWNAMRSGMQDAERDLKLADVGLKAELDKGTGESKGQVDKLKQYAGQTDIAAIAISVTDDKNNAIFEAMRSLRSQGVKVITIDSDVDREKARDTRFAYLGTDNVIGGREVGRCVKALRPDGGKYASFVGIKTAANAQQRSDGISEALGDRFKRSDYVGDGMDSNVAKKNVEDVLNRTPDINALIGIYAYNADAIAQGLKKLNMRDKVAVVNFDAAEKAIGHMEAGLIDALVVQNPYDMGYRGTKLMKALVEHDRDTLNQMFPDYEPDEDSFTKPNGDIIITGLKVVVPDKDDRLNKDLFEPTTEFMHLSEFKDWLKKYKLTGS